MTAESTPCIVPAEKGKHQAFIVLLKAIKKGKVDGDWGGIDRRG